MAVVSELMSKDMVCVDIEANLVDAIGYMRGRNIGAIVILSWVPPISKDALVHHLAVPKIYLRHGTMVELPSMVFSYYPMNLDLLYLVGGYSS